MREFYFGPNRTHFVLICRFAWFSLPSTSSSTNYSSVLFDSAVAASPSSSSSQLFFCAGEVRVYFRHATPPCAAIKVGPSLFMMSAAEESAGGRRPFIRTAATVMDRSRRPDGTTHSSLCHSQKEKKFTAICLRRTPSFRNRPETWSNTTQQYVTRQSPWKNLINVYI